MQLRAGDDSFFRRHLLAHWRPIRYQLAGVAAQAATAAAMAAATAQGPARQEAAWAAAQSASLAAAGTDKREGSRAVGAEAGGETQEEAEARPLENETWWSMVRAEPSPAVRGAWTGLPNRGVAGLGEPWPHV